MKNITILFFFTFLSIEATSQSNILLGSHWDGNVETFTSLDISTQTFTDIGILNGVESLPQGESTFDSNSNRYINITNLGITIIDAQSGAIINTIANSIGMKGIEYDPNSNRLVGSYWDGNVETFTSLDISTQTFTDIGILNGVESLTQGESTFDSNSNRYINITNLGITIIDAQSGAIINTIANFIGMKGIENYDIPITCSGSNSAYNPTTGVWSLTGSNCYYTSPYTSDALAFAQRSLCGNGSITALVTGINGTSLGWAGVIMRESNALGAKKAQLMTNMSSLHRRELRVVTNGQAFPQQFASSGRYWLRIVRQGNQFTGYASANGTDWIPVMAQIIAMNACIEIGLVVTNYQQNSTVTATFANVSHTGSGGQALAPPAIPDLLQTAPMTVDFSVFPNPTSGMLNLDLTQYIGLPVHIEVYNLQGKLLHFAEIQEVQTTIESLDLSGLHSGMYLVRVTTREFPVVTKRVVVDGKK